MARRPARDLTVGGIFALALIVLALAVMAVGSESGLWFERAHYHVVFPDATGLLVGAPVRMAGVQVGTVTQVRLPTDPTEAGIEVQVGIIPDYAERVRADSRAALRILQFLTNEKYVEIVPGSPESPPLRAGARIPLLIEVGVVERGEAIADSLGEITAALKNILGPLERGEGLIGRMLKDPDFGAAGVEALSGTLVNLNRLTDDMAAGNGTLGRLLYDETLATKLDDLGAAIDDFSVIAHRLANREGAIGALLEEGGTAEQAVDDLSAAAATLKRLAQRLESEEGLLARLLNDPEYSAALAEDLGTTLHNAAEVADKISRGEGSLGALVNERALYDGAEDVVSGVNDSKFARWLIRHYRKKGIKAREAVAPETDRQAPEP
jgi:phospholipid/cholesterol/gamma-HCH transport system substrate-binding protein